MKGLLTICMLLLGFVANAQETGTSLGSSSTTDRQERMATEPLTTEPMGMTADVLPPVEAATAEDSLHLHLPMLNQWGLMPRLMYSPIWWGGWNSWDLHEGLNVSMGASVFSTFGSGHSYHGAGFTQNVAALYARPLTDKLSFAVGGYFHRMSWAHDSWKDAGLTGILSYRFNDHWEAYLYGQKSFIDKNVPRHPLLYDMAGFGDRIGATLRYNLNRMVSFEVNVEKRR